MRISCLVAAAALVAAPLSAQQYFYVPSNTPGTGTCNVIPFGTVKSSTTWVNQKYQVHVKNSDLGNPASNLTICSLGFAPCGNQERSFDTIKITMAQTQSLPLSLTFATNLQNNVQVVLNAKDHVWPTTGEQWNDIDLDSAYVFDPTQGELVIEIEIAGNHRLSGTGLGFHRDFSNQRVYAFSYTGPPPATARGTDQAALKMRIGSANAAITNYGKGCGPGPLAIGATGSSRIGQTFSISMSGGPNTGAGVMWLGVGKSAPVFPIKLDAIGMTGCSLYCNPLIFFGAAFTGQGMSTATPVPVPNDQALVCGILCAQGAAIHPNVNPLGVTTSDYLTIVIGL